MRKEVLTSILAFNSFSSLNFAIFSFLLAAASTWADEAPGAPGSVGCSMLLS